MKRHQHPEYQEMTRDNLLEHLRIWHSYAPIMGGSSTQQLTFLTKIHNREHLKDELGDSMINDQLTPEQRLRLEALNQAVASRHMTEPTGVTLERADNYLDFITTGDIVPTGR